ERLLAAGRGHLREGRPERAADALRQGLALAEGGVPGGGAVRGELRGALDEAERARHEAERRQVVGGLHDLADLVRFQYPCDHLPGPERDHLRRACLATWGRRERARESLGEGPQVRADLLDVAVVLARLEDGEGAEAVLNAAE